MPGPLYWGKDETDSTNSVTKVYTWNDIKKMLAASGNTGGMKRMYNNRIKYRAWISGVKERYGTVTEYVYKERLRWDPLTSQDGNLVFAARSNVPFADPDDYKIAWNDWPYGSFEPEVKHLIVWLKTPLGSDMETGKILESQIDVVQAFVDKTFIQPMEAAGMDNPRENLLWFKNGFNLQSVRAIDHFHVLVRNVPAELLHEWTHEPEPVI